MGVHPDAGGDHEVARDRRPLNALAAHAAERNATRLGLERSFGGSRDAKRPSQIMGQCVRGADRKNAERDRGVRQHLHEIVNRAIAAAGKNGVATSLHHAPCFFSSMFFRIRRKQVGLDAARSQDFHGRLQFPLPPLAAA
jgi:hypothetical protein